MSRLQGMESYVKSNVNTLERREIRQELCVVQGIAHKERTGGRLSQDLIMFLAEFHKEVRAILHAENNILSFIGNTKIECIGMIQETIKVHLIGFYRAYEGKVEGSIFDMATGSKEKRIAYILEVTSMVLENIIYIQKNTKSAMRAAQNLGKYYDSDFTKEYFKGSLIADALQAEGVAMNTDEIESIFNDTKRIHFAINNIVDPLMAIQKVGKNFREVLTDTNIKEALKNEGIKMNEHEFESIFTDSKRLRFALLNINKPLVAVQKVGKNLREVLTDENIKKALKNEGIEMSEHEIQNVFTNSKRLHFAFHNIAKPLLTVRRVGKNFKKVLTNENIKEALKSEGIEMNEDKLESVFTDSKRLHLAINNIKDPFVAVRQVGKNFK